MLEFHQVLWKESSEKLIIILKAFLQSIPELAKCTFTEFFRLKFFFFLEGTLFQMQNRIELNSCNNERQEKKKCL